MLQHWMKDVITTRGSLGEKLASASRAHGFSATDAVRETTAWDARGRLQVYTSGYVLRLLECMQADHPVLLGWLGEETFNAFAKAYILSEPPRSFSVFDLSCGFAEFLLRTRPASVRAPEEEAMYLLPAELARLEYARLEAMRAEGTEHLPSSDLPVHAIDPSALSIPPCLQLLKLRLPLAEFYRSCIRGDRPGIPPLQTSYIAVSRSRYRITMEAITEDQFKILSSWPGNPADTDQSAFLAGLYLWLPVAVEKGWLGSR